MAGAIPEGAAWLEQALDYSTYLPAVETSRINAAMSSGAGGIVSRARRPGPDQTRLTWSDGSRAG
jgi:hypothetical protein